MYKKFFKRLLDIVLAIIALPFLFLLIIVVGIVIKIDDRGPVFFRGERAGKNGAPFRMFKFRTMKVNAADIRNPDGSTYNDKNDPRLTRIGNFLRVTSIDELPQILNVLIGHMSFVGPRPDLVDQKELYAHCMEKWEKRASVRPGITGYSQALYRNNLSLQERLEKDIFYVENVKFTLDVKIIFWTALSVIRREGVYKMEKQNVYELNKLTWDTEHFGISSARLEMISQINDSVFDEILENALPYEFITIRNQNNDAHNNIQIKNKTNALLVDCNVYFRRGVDGDIEAGDGIFTRAHMPVNEKIIKIAGSSFSNTRFFKDPNIHVEKAKGVSAERVKNAFEKADKFFIVFGGVDAPAGFSLCSRSEDELVCELIAVDSEFAGQGIGKKLVNAMHPLAREMGLEKLMVPTQADNIAATRLYTSTGFLPSEFHTIYHWWKAKE